MIVKALQERGVFAIEGQADDVELGVVNHDPEPARILALHQ